MDTHAKQWASGLVIVAGLGLAGCAFIHQPRGPGGSGVQESQILRDPFPPTPEGEKGQALRVYRNPRLGTGAATAYAKMFLDPVTIYYGPTSKLKDIPPDQLQNLATLFGGELADTLSDDYQRVNEPGPKTLRIQTAITDSQTTNIASKTASFVPIPRGAPGAKYAAPRSKELATGKLVWAGEVTAEVKMTDAQSGEVLFTAVDRRAGGPDAEQAFRSWAEKIRYELCTELARRTDCVVPQE